MDVMVDKTTAWSLDSSDAVTWSGIGIVTTKCKTLDHSRQLESTVKTPGGRLIYHYIHKRSKGVHCADCHAPLPGIPCLVRREMSRIPKKDRKVSRAYGGNRCHKCVRNKILRAFLTEEQKIVKRLRKARAPQKAREARRAEKKRQRALEAQKAAAEKQKEKREKKRQEKQKAKEAAKRPYRRDRTRGERPAPK